MVSIVINNLLRNMELLVVSKHSFNISKSVLFLVYLGISFIPICPSNDTISSYKYSLWLILGQNKKEWSWDVV